MDAKKSFIKHRCLNSRNRICLDSIVHALEAYVLKMYKIAARLLEYYSESS